MRSLKTFVLRIINTCIPINNPISISATAQHRDKTIKKPEPDNPIIKYQQL